MSDERYTGQTLGNGKNWSVLEPESAPIEWTVDPDQGGIQGPLDLAFLAGQRMALILEDGQQALLVENGLLRAVYLDGLHHLEIGTGRGQIDPAGRLIFLAMSAPLQLSWSCSQPLRWGPHAPQTLVGNCALRVTHPVAFFETFLLGVAVPDSGFVTRLITQTVRGLFELILTGGENAAAPALQARLTQLTPGDLNEDLADFGLSCTHLAVYTAAPPSEDDASAETVPVHQGTDA